jgi:hypothetical protein
LRRLTFALVALVCCARTSSVDEEPEDTFGEDGGSGSGQTGSGSSSGTTPKPPECAEDTKDVFVVTEENTFYQFHPPDLSFKVIGVLQCPTGGATPTSMAIDRSGTAWVRHSDGSLWKVSTRDLACEPTSFQSPIDSFQKFGMGFSTGGSGSSAELLYLSDHDGKGLAAIDTSTVSMRFIGPYTGDLAGKTSELTGTGDGKLYGFFVTAPAQIAEISKTSGEIIESTPLPDVYAGNAWAFSFYGGDFYIYTSSLGAGGFPRAGGGSDVTRYRPSDGSIEVVKPKVGFTIVGAGVSTCAPLDAPR